MQTKPPTKPQRSRCINLQPLEALNHPNALLTKRTVATVAGMSGSSIDRWVATGQFPKPVKLSARCTRWRAADVAAWLEQQKPEAANDK